MTKEEAIRILSTRDAHGALCGYTSGITEALDMAIDALSTHKPTGHIITKSSSMFQPTIWAICSECRKPIDPWDKFCRHCGVKIEE